MEENSQLVHATDFLLLLPFRAWKRKDKREGERALAPKERERVCVLEKMLLLLPPVVEQQSFLSLSLGEPNIFLGEEKLTFSLLLLSVHALCAARASSILGNKWDMNGQGRTNRFLFR